MKKRNTENEQIIIKDKNLLFDFNFPHMEPKFPCVDEDGDVWVDNKTCLREIESQFISFYKEASAKEKKIYKRYRAAWKLMEK